MQRSEQLLGKRPLDLIQVYSLKDLETRWENLREWKEAGWARYIGVTVSQEYSYSELEDFLKRESDIDFVQLNYSLMKPRSAERLIPLAADKDVAIIVNRAFDNGRYFSLVQSMELPEWSKEFDYKSCPVFLKIYSC